MQTCQTRQQNNQSVDLPYTYATKNSNDIAQELNNVQITNQHKMTTLDIKDLYVNVPIQSVINITRFWLNKTNNETTIIKETLDLIKIILNQSYFQHSYTYFKPTKGIAVGSPTSSTLAEIYLQFF